MTTTFPYPACVPLKTTCPAAAACIGVPVGRPTWRDRPSWYLVAEEDRMIAAENQHYMARRMGAVTVAHPLDHCPMIAAPQLVTEVILRAILRFTGNA